MLIAPLSANTLAKISTGICDNLITLVCRCWDMKTQENPLKLEEECINKRNQNKLIKPIIVCPAMNTMMWEHPITSKQLFQLR
jgi:phosphopantothenoylcysteine decarboxylase